MIVTQIVKSEEGKYIVYKRDFDPLTGTSYYHTYHTFDNLAEVGIELAETYEDKHETPPAPAAPHLVAVVVA